MFNKSKFSPVIITMVSICALYSASALGSEPIAQKGSQAITPLSHVTAEIDKAYKCPAELRWRDLETISNTGMDFKGRHFDPVNKENFNANMPGKANFVTTSGQLGRPTLTTSEFKIDPSYNVELHCTYPYHTVASGLGSVAGSEGYKLEIKTVTDFKVTMLDIESKATHLVLVAVFPADASGKLANESTYVRFRLGANPNGVKKDATFFTNVKQSQYFIPQAQYEGGLGICAVCPPTNWRKIFSRLYRTSTKKYMRNKENTII